MHTKTSECEIIGLYLKDLKKYENVGCFNVFKLASFAGNMEQEITIIRTISTRAVLAHKHDHDHM